MRASVQRLQCPGATSELMLPLTADEEWWLEYDWRSLSGAANTGRVGVERQGTQAPPRSYCPLNDFTAILTEFVTPRTSQIKQIGPRIT